MLGVMDVLYLTIIYVLPRLTLPSINVLGRGFVMAHEAFTGLNCRVGPLPCVRISRIPSAKQNLLRAGLTAGIN